MSVAPARIAVADEAELERRARALASGETGLEEAPAGVASITFRLGSVRCAVEASVVERAIQRLGTVFTVPLASGGARAAAFVDEEPLPVVDLAKPARDLDSLRNAPALLVAAASEIVAVAVDGPLELTDAPLMATTELPPLDGDAPRVAGRLRDGAVLLEAGWIRELAARACAP